METNCFSILHNMPRYYCEYYLPPKTNAQCNSAISSTKHLQIITLKYYFVSHMFFSVIRIRYVTFNTFWCVWKKGKVEIASFFVQIVFYSAFCNKIRKCNISICGIYLANNDKECKNEKHQESYYTAIINWFMKGW